MRRTQLYLDEALWDVLRLQARSSRKTMSDLVRDALREKYMSGGEERKRALSAMIGLWKDRTDLPEDTDVWIRKMREDRAIPGPE